MWLTTVVISGVALSGGARVWKAYKRKHRRPLIKRIAANPSPKSQSAMLTNVPYLQDMIQQQSNYLQIIFDDPRRAHQEAIAIESIAESEARISSRHRVKVALANLGLTTVALTVFPPLLLATIPFYAYTFSAAYREALGPLLKRGEINTSLFSAMIATGFIAGGMFPVAALELTLASLVRYLVVRTEDHSKSSLSSLFGTQSSTAWIRKDDLEIEIPLEQVCNGDIVIVTAGQIVPVDGIIVDGMASIDQHMLTGESQPAEKTVGDEVLASTVLHSGKIQVRVEKTGEETVAAHIGHILNQTTDFKEVVQARADSQSTKMFLPVMALSALALPFGGVNSATAVAMNVPAYKMRYFGPISMLNYLNIAARRSILVKDGRSLELLRTIDTIVFDKTGTLTLEQPQVHRIYTVNSFSENELLTLAAAAEERQSHPIALAILAEADDRQLVRPAIDDIQYEVGYGIKVQIDNQVVRVGSERYMDMEQIDVPAEICRHQADCHEHGYSLILVAIDNHLAGAIELHPTIRPEATSMIQQFKDRGVDLVIISGDHEGPTRQLANQLGIDRYFAQVLPEDKAILVAQLQDEGRSVCFVGDGINDAIALKKADVSVSLSGATTVATDSAQIVLMDGGLTHLIDIFTLAQEFEEITKSNVAISTIPAIFCIGGVFLLGWSTLTAVFVSQSIFFSGFLNSMRPLFRHMKHASTESAIQ